MIGDIETALQIYASVANRWKGCAWSTKIGAAQHDLDGMRSEQAIQLAENTEFTPEERDGWMLPVAYLQMVEEDAALAEAAAFRAVEHLKAGRYQQALESMGLAAQYERAYNQTIWYPVWFVFNTAILDAEKKRNEP